MAVPPEELGLEPTAAGFPSGICPWAGVRGPKPQMKASTFLLHIGLCIFKARVWVCRTVYNL